MDYRQARLELKKGQLHPLYLFSGSEDYLKEELFREMLQVMRQRGLEPDLLRIDGRKLEWGDLRREWEQVTIFSRGRVLLVKDVPYFSAAPGKAGASLKVPQTGKKQKRQTATPGEDELAALLSAGVADTILIFSVPEVDRRKKLTRYLEKAGVLVTFPALKRGALARWIRDEAARENKRINDDALAALVQRSGGDLTLLKRELEKAVLYLGTDDTIDLALIEKLVPENTQGNIFNLVDELGDKNAPAALVHFHRMRRQNEPPLRILTMIIRHFRLLYRARLLYQEGLPAAKISPILQVPPFVTGKLLEQLANFSTDSLLQIIISLKETDLLIKTGRLSGEEALEQLVYKLACG